MTPVENSTTFLKKKEKVELKEISRCLIPHVIVELTQKLEHNIINYMYKVIIYFIGNITPLMINDI